MTSLLDYLNRIRPDNLKVAPARADTKPYPLRGKSPYKPMLLLAVLQAIRDGDAPFTRGIIEIADCRGRFESLYTSLAGDSRIGDLDVQLSQPFWYFGAGVPRIWTLVPREGRESELKRAIAAGTQVKSVGKLDSLVSCAELSASDLNLLSNDVANTAISAFVIRTYFTGIETEVFEAVASAR